MKVEKCTRDSFVVIGKEGSTEEGNGFIQRLWEEANANFREVEPLAKRDEKGELAGFWGAMSDMSHSFSPWEDNFSRGLYLAGAECNDDAQAPDGWTKWVIPAYEYLYVECDGMDTFPKMLQYMKDNDISLAGAVHDYTCPQSGKNYMFFPIRKLNCGGKI